MNGFFGKTLLKWMIWGENPLFIGHFHIAPLRRPGLLKETHLPTIDFQGRLPLVSGRVSFWVFGPYNSPLGRQPKNHHVSVIQPPFAGAVIKPRVQIVKL